MIDKYNSSKNSIAPILCVKLLQQYLLINRFNRLSVAISLKTYKEILNLCRGEVQISPDWLKRIWKQLQFVVPKAEKIADFIFIKTVSGFGFVNASYEITEQCNYRCSHCYIGERKKSQLKINEKKYLIDLIEKAGCLWLQITGGEPFFDKDFEAIYLYAYKKGILMNISTNLSLLSTNSRIRDLFIQYHPYKIAVSLYGATKKSYEAITNTVGSFELFISSLELAKKANFNIRLNIIQTKFNSKETKQMVALAQSFGFEYHVYSKMVPTLTGNSDPLSLSIDCKKNRNKFAKCFAGKSFFHIDLNGYAGVCKLERSKQVNLFDKGLMGINSLPKLSKILLEPPKICQTCSHKTECSTCAPEFYLYKNAGSIPSYICKLQNKPFPSSKVLEAHCN